MHINFKNASYVFVSNCICVIINIFVNFLIPMFFEPNAYAYYQMENLYCGYLWIITLGWHEGVYLYYGGKESKDVDKRELSTNFWGIGVYLLLACIPILIIGKYVLNDSAKQFILYMSMLSILFEAVRYVYLYYLICINSMKKYAFYLLLDRIVYIIFVIFLIFTCLTNYHYVIGVDILSKMLLLIIIIFQNKKDLLVKPLPIKESMKKIRMMIKIGKNITLSSFVNRWINGTVRLAIDTCWGLLIFGKISLTLSLSNMVTQFVQSISVVLFPILRRSGNESKERTFYVLSNALDILIFTLFLFFLPGVHILRIILPLYSDGLKYMVILLPICLFDVRYIVLNNTYLKTLHREKSILLCSIITVGFSFVLTFFSAFVLKNLDLTVAVIVMLVMIRNVCTEIVLSKSMRIEMGKRIISEWIMISVFIYSYWSISGIKGFACYLSVVLLFYYTKKEYLMDIYVKLKKQKNSKNV